MTLFDEFRQKLQDLYDVDNLTSTVKHPVFKVFHFTHTPILDELLSLICPLNHHKLHQIHSVHSFASYACISEFSPYQLDVRIVLAPTFIRISLDTSLMITINVSTIKENLTISYNLESYPISALLDESLYEIMYQNELDNVRFIYPDIKSFSDFHVKNSQSVDDIKIAKIKSDHITYFSLEGFKEKLTSYPFDEKIKDTFDLNISDFNSLFLNFTDKNFIRNINTIHSLLCFESHLDGNLVDQSIRTCVYNDIPFKFYADYYFYTVPMPYNARLGFNQCLALGTQNDVLSYHTLKNNSPFYADNQFENSIFGYDNIYKHIRDRIKNKIMITLNLEDDFINSQTVELYSMMQY